MTKLKKALLYAGLEPEEYQAVIPDARRENQKLLPMYTTAAVVVFAGLFCLSGVLKVNYVENRWVYLAMMLVNLGFYLCAVSLVKKFPGLTEPLALCFIAALYEFSFFISLNHPDLPAVTPVALLLVIPYFFDFRPIYEIAMTLFAASLYCLLSAQVKTHVIAMDDLWNVGTFTLVACIVSVVQARMKYRLMHQSLINHYLSETDILTKVGNRTAYERHLADYGRKCINRVACVYADVNGLHEMNNTQGHEAGDRMLQSVADAMKNRFGKENTYRVGGDEFVSLLMDVSPEDICRGVDAVKAEIKAAGYDTSFGTAVREEKDISMYELVREAEREMYIEKQKYYSQEIHDRRKPISSRRL